MRFVVTSSSAPVRITSFPFVTLRRDNWDDYKFKTLFDVTITLSTNEAIDVGAVKILRRGQASGQTPLEPSFESLDDSYCSLGQSLAYYEMLQVLPDDVRSTYLLAMRDATTDASIEGRFSGENGWETSLLRFGEARNALEAGRRLMHGEAKQVGVLSFAYEFNGDGGQLRVPFNFDDADHLPGRCNVLIGYNGAGKTHLLADIARVASGFGRARTDREVSRLTGADTTFARVVGVSYSAFDTFITPSSVVPEERGEGRTELFGYVYCGLRKLDRQDSRSIVDRGSAAPLPSSHQLKSIEEIEHEFAVALQEASDRDEQRPLLTAFGLLSEEPSFGRIGVDLRDFGRGVGGDQILQDFRRLSTGHKIVVNIITQLSAHLRDRSLVLIDEPETHLHPPLMAALLKAIQSLLDAYDSFAIIATHSPVVVQEMPARYVQVVERIGDRTSVHPPAVETFGEGVGAITRQVFSLDSSATDYQGKLRELAQAMTLDEIEALFEDGLSVQARALVLNYLHGGR
jgi:energy-coupling factor transporter ATP-binding protein EcfA2